MESEEDDITEEQERVESGSCTMRRASPGQDSEHLSKLSYFKVKPELIKAADVLLMAYPERFKDPQLMKFYEYLKDVLTQPEPGLPTQTSASNWPGWNWLSTKKKVKVHTITTGETFGADAALMRQVANCEDLQVKVDQRGGSVVLLFCPITSRPGSDVKVAMSKVSGDKPVILVVMHHTRKPDYCTTGPPWSDNFPNIILHVDVLFHETLGLLTCSNNDAAVRQIQDKLLKM